MLRMRYGHDKANPNVTSVFLRIVVIVLPPYKKEV